MCQDFVQPLERPIEVQLDPTGRGSDGLATIFRAPAFDETHPNRAHPRQLVNRFKPLTDALRQQRRKFLVIEDLEIATGWNFADGGGMPAVALIAVGRLDEDGRLGKTFGENLAADVVETDAASNVPPRHLYRARPVDVGK